MTASAELLWHLNRNYVNRLARARSYFDLLEPLLMARRMQVHESLLSALQFTHDRLTFLTEEQRRWCYAYFYESPDTKRMVQTSPAIRQALHQFHSMCDRHVASLNEVIVMLADLPRPDPAMTRVAGGDLWDLMQTALDDLVDFSNDLLASNTA